VNPEEYAIMFRAEDTHWWYRGLRALLDDRWARHLSGPGPLRVLDIGCGTGAVLEQLQARSWGAGIDVAAEALACCRRRKALRIAQASAQALPFGGGCFDAAVLLDVLYHREVPDPLAPLREVRRVLKPEGVLLLNVPAYQWLYSSHDAAIHTRRRFTRGEVEALMNAASFEVLEASYWNTLLFPAIVLARLVRKQAAGRGSDLVRPPGILGARAGAAALALERRWMRLCPLPFGLSIFAVGRSR